jgi:vacuolar iron transporter family protein
VLLPAALRCRQHRAEAVGIGKESIERRMVPPSSRGSGGSGRGAGRSGGRAEAREAAARHIQEHSLGEAARIGKLSRIREFVLGAQDGLLVPLGVVTGMAAANPARSLIIVAGLAEAVAGAISMGGGSYLASQAEEQLYLSEIAAEGREIDEFPQRETDELALVLEREGLPRDRAESVARGLASNPNVFLRTKVEKELGLSADTGGAAAGDAAVVGATYLGAAIVPLWPYFLFSLHTALAISLACTLFALFAVGVAKGRVTRLSLARSGVQVMIVGSLSAGIGFAIGHVVTAFSG